MSTPTTGSAITRQLAEYAEREAAFLAAIQMALDLLAPLGPEIQRDPPGCGIHEAVAILTELLSRLEAPATDAAPPIARCACGRTYTDGQWSALRYVGMWGDEEETLEFRNCRCDSTIAVGIDDDGHRRAA